MGIRQMCESVIVDHVAHGTRNLTSETTHNVAFNLQKDNMRNAC